MLGTVMTGVMGALGIVAGVVLLAHFARRGADRLTAGWQAWDDEAFAGRKPTTQDAEVNDADLR